VAEIWRNIVHGTLYTEYVTLCRQRNAFVSAAATSKYVAECTTISERVSDTFKHLLFVLNAVHLPLKLRGLCKTKSPFKTSFT